MAREYLSFDNWTLGDTGRHGPMAFHYGRRKMLASYGHFRGLNVLRYPNGAIGPRPPLEAYTAGGTIIGNLAFVEYTYGADVLYVITDTGDVYRQTQFLRGGGSWAHTATSITPLCTGLFAEDLYIGAAGGVYRVTAGGTFTGPFANSPASPRFIVSYREVLTAAGFGSGSVSYSAPGDGTTWPSTNTLGIGTGNLSIVGLFAQKNSLVSVLPNGEFWTTTGFLTQGGTVGNDVTRRADLGPTFTGVPTGTSTMQSTIWYVNGRDACNFTGAQTGMEPLPDVEGLPGAGFDLTSSAATVSHDGLLMCTGIEPVLTQPDAFIVVGSAAIGGVIKNFGMLRQGSMGWTRHFFPVTVSPQNRHLPLVKSTFGGYTFFLSQQTSTVTVYKWRPRLETPYLDSLGDPLLVPDADSGDVVSGSFSLPEWWVPDGGSAHVHGVMVDFEYDPNAIARTVANGNTADKVVKFDLTVDALNLDEDDGNRTSTVVNWTPPASASTAAPTSVQATTRRRELFRVGDQGPGTGFHVNFTNMKGVQIYRAVVVVDLDDMKRF